MNDNHLFMLAYIFNSLENSFEIELFNFPINSQECASEFMVDIDMFFLLMERCVNGGKIIIETVLLSYNSKLVSCIKIAKFCKENLLQRQDILDLTRKKYVFFF